jgi:MFS family permease
VTRAAAWRRLSGMKRWTLILPIIVFIYIIAYIDRTNISFALPHLKQDMGLTGSQQGFVSGVFFFGYLLLQVPGGYMAERWSAKNWIAILMVLWSACAIFSGLTHTYSELVLARFLLGVAEGGVQPALMTTIRSWFPFSERGRAYAIFKLYTPISSLVAAPLSGVILTHGTWRDLFIIQGAVPLILGIVAWLAVMRDTPAKAKWLSAAERTHIENARLREGEPLQHRGTFRAAFTSRIVWMFALIYTLTQLGLLGLTIWLPTLLKQSFHTDFDVGLAAMLPAIGSAVAIFLVGRSADRHGRHITHIAVTLAVGAVVLGAAGFLSANHRWLVLAAMVVATAASIAWYGPFWAMVTKLMPVAAASAGIGIVNGVGNLGGFIGPYVGGVLSDLSGGYVLTQLFFGLIFAVAALLVISLRRRMREAETEGRDPLPAVSTDAAAVGTTES